MFHLVKALASVIAEVRISFLTTHHEGASRPAHRALAGLFKTLTLESPGIMGQVIEIDDAAHAAGVVMAELSAPLEDIEISYVGGERFVSGHAPMPFRSRSHAKPALRQGGVYLISGGLGGLGRAFAEHLLREYQAKLLLIGRSPLDQVRDRMSDLARLGGAIEYASCDVASREQIARLRDLLAAQYAGLNGLIHAAGVIEDAFFEKKEWSSFTRVLGPKVHGLVNLDELTAEFPLDFFTACSSATSVLGNYGQADYAYANAFMDHYMQMREAKRACVFQSVVCIVFCIPFVYYHSGYLEAVSWLTALPSMLFGTYVIFPSQKRNGASNQSSRAESRAVDNDGAGNKSRIAASVSAIDSPKSMAEPATGGR